MVHLLGWHWEFLPSFFAKLVPGVDLVPFWTLAVANVYRKAKRIAEASAAEQQPELPRSPDQELSRGPIRSLGKGGNPTFRVLRESAGAGVAG